MSFKKSSMPSINESDNDDDNESLSANGESISTSDYSSLKREKNATLTKVINDLSNVGIEEEANDKVATLKNNQFDVDVVLNGDRVSLKSDGSSLSLSAGKQEDIQKHFESTFNDENQTDRFGFYKGSHYTDPESDLNISIDVMRSREKKWQEMLNKWGEYKTKKRKKLLSRCRKGIPQSMRCRAWQLLCNSKSLDNSIGERAFYKEQIRKNMVRSGTVRRSKMSRISLRGSSLAIGGGGSSDCDNVSVNSFMSTVTPVRRTPGTPNPLFGESLGSFNNQGASSYYRELYENYQKMSVSSEIKEQIRKDIHRQFPDHENFTSRGGMGQESLEKLLTVYSIRHPETGYCQGMAPLAALLLMVMPEEDAFWTFDNICDTYIPGYYDEGLRQIQVDAKALTALLRKESYTVYQYLKKSQIDPICFMIDWFMCIFIRTLPWPSVLIVMDMFLCEGKSILFKVAIVLIIGSVTLHRKTQPEEYVNNLSNSICQPDTELLSVLRHLPSEITTPKYLTSHMTRLSVTKSDIRRQCELQQKLMDKLRSKQNATGGSNR